MMAVTKLVHGCYSTTTALTTTQHAYTGARGGYIEALEITTAPGQHHPIVLVHYNRVTGTYSFVEFATVGDASREVHRLEWGRGSQSAEDFYPARAGFMRYVELTPGQLPWFYAPDPNLIIPGCDFVLPE
jgi:hypothetical protein